jgi:peptidoglycan/LPS O-acetylase OafA/YrhL
MRAFIQKRGDGPSASGFSGLRGISVAGSIAAMQVYKSKGEIASLNGLRGLAALVVVIAHYCHWTAVTPVSALPESLERWTRTSFVGMAIFFTLSGYVIALSYSDWNWRQRPGLNLARLLFYRFARLYPAYFVFVLIIILRWPALQDVADPGAVSYLLSHLFLMQSWWPVKFDGDLAAHGHFHVSWSLSVEWALYLGFGVGAIIVAMLPSWRGKTLLVGAAFFISVWALLQKLDAPGAAPSGWSANDWNFWLFFYSPCAVSLQFGIGVAAYRLSRLPMLAPYLRAVSEIGGLGLIVTYVRFATGSATSAFDESMLASLATGFVLIGALSDSMANRILSGRAIVYVGTISYSLYLFHFLAPPIALHGRHFDAYTSAAAAFHAVNFAASLALTIVIAAGVYGLVEVPGRRFIRGAADRILGLDAAPIIKGERAPAE